MRLVCPNCGATYQVAGDLIPADGRDVECSACGHGWLAFAPVAESLLPAPLPQSTVTPEVAEILRAEAARETRVRADERAEERQVAQDRGPVAEKPANEDQTPVPPPLFRPATKAEAEAAAAARAAAAAAKARDVVSADVRPVSQAAAVKTPAAPLPAEPVKDPGAHGGFLIGFLAAGGIALVGVLTYHGAPALMQSWPESAPYLQPYVSTIDGWRIWLQDQATALTTP
ncbi:zinc-ribbon domain-containing protein [Ketogulonicigenium vulgare]|nr:zinc-ribbon domain-containing protein [Ketogulonicigenium vulgare]ADO41753.1 MJ0042 family finger-like protein [Ketogulonicigenium vulgare Y25]ALJ80193.1 hypothetical protein KVH_02785 [Ketogulonicigenium vulgare]ANW33054.1 hypothetical protein KvSKV_02780 [Ketogulonicigenium vulgare]AOZ53684.1 MJ0042 family finger-like protein domain protein [Ketogulonicigenium vulgare]